MDKVKPFRPMLADPADFALLRFPLYASVKIDGIRATIHRGVACSRSMKPLPNAWLQECVARLPSLEGCDGEFLVGPPTAADVFRQTTSHVMSDSKRDYPLHFEVFDLHDHGGAYAERLAALMAMEGHWNEQRILPVRPLRQRVLIDLDSLDAYEAEALAAGYEGVMTRDPHARYKQGRATANGQELLKIKRAADLEAEVIGYEELLHNGNVGVRNEIGRTARSSSKAGKTGLGSLGALIVRGSPGSGFDGVEFNVGGGFTAADRAFLWERRDRLAGRIAKVKHFPIGAVDRPRHPIFLGWRDPRDLSE